MKAKIIRIILTVLVCNAVFFWSFKEQTIRYPQKEYTAVLTDKGYPKNEKHHLTLGELKGDVASISIEAEGVHLLTEGESYKLGRNGHFILGDYFSGTIKVLSIEKEKVTVAADLETEMGYYLWSAILSGALTGVVYLLFTMMMNLVIKCASRMKRKKKRRHLRVIGESK